MFTEMNTVFNYPSWFGVCMQEFDFAPRAESYCFVLGTSGKCACMVLLKQQFHWLQKAAAAELILQVLGHVWRGAAFLKGRLAVAGNFAAEEMLLDSLPCQEAETWHLCLKVTKGGRM